MELLVVFGHVEVYRAVAFVGVAGIENLFNELYLLDDVSACVGLDRGGQYTQLIHKSMVAVGVVLSNLHRFELFEACFFGDFVFALIGIVFEVAHVGNVTNVAHLVAEGAEVAEQQVEGDCGPGVSQVWIAIDGRAADIHTHVFGVKWNKLLFASSESVV